ncbi:hypothetical protein F5050DRAFT_1479922 [Lentinula boryana]|uniref:SET domain-containing protein n=1 Tax=Lentinula boryana TaxID=40481 RepID=A0ABQ8QFB5_9AGAR|nr:hypothetical protein F5050DRAFT_1479922 [Lentinula boryana]
MMTKTTQASSHPSTTLISTMTRVPTMSKNKNNWEIQGMILDSPPLPSSPLPSSPLPSSLPLTPHPPTLANFPILTWSYTRSLLRSTPPPHHYSSLTLTHTMHDYINSYNPQMRSYPQMTLVYSSMIQENTSRDEPLAPPIVIVPDSITTTGTATTTTPTPTTPPWEFYYTNEMLLGRSVPPPSRANLTGCNCLLGQCHLNKSHCTCYLNQQSFTSPYGITGFMYHPTTHSLKSNGLPVFECNSLCGCDERCLNRVVGRGRKIPIMIQKTRRKGWGVFACCFIPKGTFIGIYSGELLGHEESEERAIKYDEFGRTYLFDIDWWYINQQLDSNQQPKTQTQNTNTSHSHSHSHSRRPSKYTVDAYHAGNFTRFLNHSCDPNSALTPVYIDIDDIERPLLTVFSKRAIEPGEEITFSYSGDPDFDDEDEGEEGEGEEGEEGEGEGEGGEEGEEKGKGKSKSKKGDARVHVDCECGAKNCKGTIWRLE